MIGFSIVVAAVGVLGLGWFLGLIVDRVSWPWVAPVTEKLKFVFFVLFLIGTVVIIAEVLLKGTAGN